MKQRAAPSPGAGLLAGRAAEAAAPPALLEQAQKSALDSRFVCRSFMAVRSSAAVRFPRIGLRMFFKFLLRPLYRQTDLRGADLGAEYLQRLRKIKVKVLPIVFHIRYDRFQQIFLRDFLFPRSVTPVLIKH